MCRPDLLLKKYQEERINCKKDIKQTLKENTLKSLACIIRICMRKNVLVHTAEKLTLPPYYCQRHQI